MRGFGDLTVLTEPRAEPMSLAEAKSHLKVENSVEDALISSWVTTARMHAEAVLQRALVLQTLELAFEHFWDVFSLSRSPIMKFGSLRYRDSLGAMQTLASNVYQVDTRSEPGRLTRAYNQVWPQIRGGEDLHSVLIEYQAGYLAPVAAASDTNDTLQVEDNPFVDGDKVYVSQSGGAVPTGLIENTPYYVVNTAANLFKLSLTAGGAAIDLTSVGSGSIYVSKRKFPDPIKSAMKLMLAHWHKERAESVTGTIIARIPQGARNLLMPYRLMGMR